MESEQLLLFCELTGADPDQALQYLKLAENELDLAVQLYYSSHDTEHPPPTASSSSSSSSLTFSGYQSPTRTTRVSTSPPITTRTTTIDEDKLANNHDIIDLNSDIEDDVDIRSPLKRSPQPVSFGSFHSNTRSIIPPILPTNLDSLNPFNQHIRPYSVPTSSVGLAPRSSLSTHSAHRNLEVESKESKLANLFRPPIEILFKGTFDYAKQHGKVEKKWLLIDLQNPQEFSCQVLNRDIWKSPQLQELVQANFLFLQLYCGDREGQQYQSFYPVAVFPHVAILDPRTGERMKVLAAGDLVSPGYTMIALANFLEGHSLEPESPAPGVSVATSVPPQPQPQPPPALLQPQMTSKSTSTVCNDADPIAQLTPLELPEPDVGPRVQIRLPDGTRYVRRFDTHARVADIYRFLKAKSSEAASQPFALMHLRDNLDRVLEKSIVEAGLDNAAISLVFT